MIPRQSAGKSQPYQSKRFLFAFLLLGQVWLRLLQGKTYYHRVLEHMFQTGPASLIPVLLVNGFGGMIFTIQTARQLIKLDALNSVGGVFAIAFCRELAPIITASIVAGQVGSAFAAEIAAMKVSEQIDALYTLKTNPLDYLVLPRVLASCAMMPILMILGLVCGVAGGAIAASVLYSLDIPVFLDSVRDSLKPLDLVRIGIKGILFGGTIAIVSCAWGLTTKGGSKEVGESATAAVIVSGVVIFAIDLLLSLFLFGEILTDEIP
jgi:phospholipid/cholesterol/gamma-HCH transport system permease protein